MVDKIMKISNQSDDDLYNSFLFNSNSKYDKCETMPIHLCIVSIYKHSQVQNE